MNMQMIKVVAIALNMLFIACCIWIGLFNEVTQPFVSLPVRIKLLSYPNYIALLSGPVLFLGVIVVCIHQLFHPIRDRFSYSSWGYSVAVLTLIIAVVAFGNRVYLGIRVDQAGYVKCVKESRTSSKSSWRVYAKDISLCKSSSGIAGG